MSRRIHTLAVGVALVVLAAACGDDGGDAGGTIRGIVRDPAPTVDAVTLPDVTEAGEDFVFRAEADELLVVYFGYTSCPDVCPTTLADLRQALADLDDADAERVDVAMATIDPAHDTEDVLTAYVRSFVPDAHALVTDDDARLRRAADAFGASYGVETNDDGEPEVFHTGFLYAVDDEGRLAVTWPFGVPAEDFAHDIEILLSET